MDAVYKHLSFTPTKEQKEAIETAARAIQIVAGGVW